MTDFFELFNPGLRHLHEQRDLEKVLVVQPKKGGTGPQPLELESGKVTIVMPTGSARNPAGEPEPGSTQPPD